MEYLKLTEIGWISMLSPKQFSTLNCFSITHFINSYDKISEEKIIKRWF